jgi:hypothetical protein
MPNPIPTSAPTSMVEERDRSLTMSWPYSVEGRPVVLYANFVSMNGEWTVCSWDTADI